MGLPPRHISVERMQTPYPILDPAHPIPALKHLCALTVMAKAPRPGKVKTRLSPPFTLDQTAALNIRFLRDTTENLATIPGSGGLISYTPVGDEALFAGLLPDTFGLVPQRGDGFGERLLFAAQDILAIGYGAVCLIDSDSPTVPAAAYAQAVEALAAPGDRVVLGPSHDGGYYLIGMKRPHPEPFERITWSTASVCEETIERCREANLEVVTLPVWYDVDDAPTLAILTEELLNDTVPTFSKIPGYKAPHTRELLLAMQFDPAAAGPS
jgi:rSAM/selenodomain-associated transferase 1